MGQVLYDLDVLRSFCTGISLGSFARAHPLVRIEARVARSDELRRRFALGQFDLALLWDAGMDPSCGRGEHVMRLPLRWIGSASPHQEEPGWPRRPGLRASAGDALPLVFLDAPCPLRGLVTSALDNHGIAWRHAFDSGSLTAVWAAVAAGLGLSVRTPFGLPASVKVLDAAALGLPELPSMDLILGRASAAPQAPVDRLAEILVDAVREHMHLRMLDDAAAPALPRPLAIA